MVRGNHSLIEGMKLVRSREIEGEFAGLIKPRNQRQGKRAASRPSWESGARGSRQGICNNTFHSHTEISKEVFLPTSLFSHPGRRERPFDLGFEGEHKNMALVRGEQSDLAVNLSES